MNILKIKQLLYCENLAQMKRLKLFFIVPLMLLLAITFVSATNELQGDYPFSVTNWKVDEISSGRIPNNFGSLQYYSTFPPDVSASSLPYGSTIQPLTADINNDGRLEIIGTSTTYLNVYRVNDNQQLTVLDQIDLSSGTLTLQPSIYNGTYSQGIIVPTIYMIYAIEWNSTSNRLFVHHTLNLSGYGDAKTGVRCVSLYVPEDTCVFITSSSKVIKYAPRSNTVTNFTATGYTPYGYTTPPPISDQNRDNVYEIAWAYNYYGNSVGYVVYDFNGNHHYHGCVGANSNNGGGCTNTHVTTRYSNMAFVFGQYCSGFLWWKSCNFDGYLVLVTDESTSDAGYGTSIFEIQSNGAFLRAMVVSPSPSGAPASAYTSAAFGEFTGAIKEVCAISQGSSSLRPIKCFNLETGDVTQTMASKYVKSFTTHSIATGDYNGDGYDEIITDSQMISPHNNNTLNWSLVPSGTIILSDVTQDGIGEIITTANGNTAVAFSSYTNSPPTYISRTLDRNFDSPVCYGTTVTFGAYQCGYTYTHCQYGDAENYDKERLVADCGDGTLINGSLHYTHPQVSCYFDNIGSNQVQVWLQDDKHLDDYTQLKVMQYDVNNGTAGINCNIPLIDTTGANVTVVTPSPEGTLTQDDIDYITRTLTGGGSPLVKSILVVCFTIGIIGLLAKWGIHNPVIYTGAIFALWICLALVSLISWIFVIIFAFVMMLVSAIFFVKGNSQGQ